MKKGIYIFLLLFLMNALVSYAVEDLKLRDYSPVTIPKGAFVQVMNLQEFSTKYCDDATKLKFSAVDDTYMLDVNIIPKGTLIFGEIDKMNEPITGTNASMIVKLTKIRLSDGFEIPIKASIYTNNRNLIGGEMTPPASYRKIPHYQEGLGKGTLRWVPGPTLKMGEHITVASGAILMMVFDSPAYITHTLTN